MIYYRPDIIIKGKGAIYTYMDYIPIIILCKIRLKQTGSKVRLFNQNQYTPMIINRIQDKI